MKEKIVTAIVVGVLETAFITACATAGSLFADCIKMKIVRDQAKKDMKKTKG